MFFMKLIISVLSLFVPWTTYPLGFIHLVRTQNFANVLSEWSLIFSRNFYWSSEKCWYSQYSVYL